MSVPAAPRLTPAVTLGLISAREQLDRALAHQANDAPPTAAPPRPYEVRIRSGMGDSIFIVGHDRLGAPMVELRIRRRHLTPGMVRRMERWCRDHDEPDLHLI